MILGRHSGRGASLSPAEGTQGAGWTGFSSRP